MSQGLKKISFVFSLSYTLIYFFSLLLQSALFISFPFLHVALTTHVYLTLYMSPLLYENKIKASMSFRVMILMT